jgi:hypothetical protein
MRCIQILIIYATLFVSSSAVFAATPANFKQIVITGQTPITAKLSDATYRIRALEQALHQLVTESTKQLKSFSLVEDGQLLIDQIQSHTNIQIFEYQILQSRKSRSKYEVDVQFLYADTSDKPITTRCRIVPYDHIETFVSLTSETKQNIQWAKLDLAKIAQDISTLSFRPSVNLNPVARSQKKNTSLYKLKHSASPYHVYKLEVDVRYSSTTSQNVLGKKSILSIQTQVKTTKDEKNILHRSYSEDFVVDQKTLGNIALAQNRRNWRETENKIYDFIIASVAQQVREAECANLPPELMVSNQNIDLNHGSAEGIQKSDLIIAQDLTGKEVFFKIDKLGKHSSSLSVISKFTNFSSLRPGAVTILNGG